MKPSVLLSKKKISTLRLIDHHFYLTLKFRIIEFYNNNKTEQHWKFKIIISLYLSLSFSQLYFSVLTIQTLKQEKSLYFWFTFWLKTKLDNIWKNFLFFPLAKSFNFCAVVLCAHMHISVLICKLPESIEQKVWERERKREREREKTKKKRKRK